MEKFIVDVYTNIKSSTSVHEYVANIIKVNGILASDRCMR